MPIPNRGFPVPIQNMPLRLLLLLILAALVASPAAAAGTAPRSLVATTGAPTITITSQPPSPTSATTATIAWTSQPALAATCALDSRAPAFACSSPLTLTGLSAGTHTLAIREVNPAGSGHALATWTVSSLGGPSAPSVKITSGPSASTTLTTAAFTFTSANAATVSCALDGAAPVACSGSTTYNGLGLGPHAFVVTASSGTMSASASAAWTVAAATNASANAWVDSNGGTCVGSGAPLAYSDPAACGSFQAAIAALPAGGGVVRVTCGIYPPQTLGRTGKTGVATIASEQQTCATVEAHGALAVTFGAGASKITLDHLTIHGLIHGSSTSGAGNDDVVLSNNDINVGTKVNAQSITFSVGNRISIVRNTIGPSCCGYNGGNGVSPEGIRIGKPNATAASCTTQVCNLVIDGNTIQGIVRDCALWPSSVFGACPDTTCTNASGCHGDGIHIWGVDGGLIEHNRLYGVECQGIFIENANAALNRNISIIDNAIAGLPGGCGSKGIYVKAAGTISGTSQGFAGAWTIAFNSGGGTLIGPNGCGQCQPGTTFKVVGNAMPLLATNSTGNSAGCIAGWGAAAVSYAYNVWAPTGTNTACGPTDKLALVSFVNPVTTPSWGSDYHLGAAGPADNLVPASVCQAVIGDDLDGQPRGTTGNCDAGADER
jgi:hypothetical protein